MKNPEDLTPPERIKSLAAIMVAISVAGMGMGLTGPMITYAFENAGYSRTVTGLNTATFALAILLFAPVVPSVMRRIGTVRLLWLSMAGAILGLIAFRLTDNVVLWFVIRFYLGVTITMLFVATEVWINLIALENTRGRVFGVYATCLSGGFGIGLGILYFVGSVGWAPVWVTVALFAVAGLPLIPAQGISPLVKPPHEPTRVLSFLRKSPTALLAAIVFGAVEMGILNLLNIYALRAGLPETTGTLMLLSTAAGNLAGPILLGMLADHMDRRTLLVCCAAVGTITSFLVPISLSNPLLLYAFLFVNGAIIIGLYTVGLTLLGERFKGAAVAEANAAFITMYGLGALFGPFLAGVAMDIWDPTGLMVVFGTLCGGYALLVFARIRRRASLTGGAA